MSHQPEVHRITDARESHTVEKDGRMRKYMISMSVRMLCFILAFFFEGWMRWAMIAAAAVLPYVAVVLANGGADVTKREPAAEFYHGDEPGVLDAPAAPAEPHAGEEVIDGTLAGEPEDKKEE